METATITRDQLEALLDLKDRAVRRDIDAATCGGTHYDRGRAEKAEDALADAIDRLFGIEGEGEEVEGCAFEAGETPNRYLCACSACEKSHPSRNYRGSVPQEWIIDRD